MRKLLSLRPSDVGHNRLLDILRSFDGVELKLSKHDPLSKDTRLLVDTLEDKDVNILSVHAPNFQLTWDRDREKAYSLVLSLHERLGVNNFVFHPGRMTYREDFFRFFEWLSENIPDSIKISVEIMSNPKSNLSSVGTILDAYERWKEIPNLGFCLDTSHIPYDSIEEYNTLLMDTVDAMRDKLFHVHVSDISRGIATKSIKHLPLGEGVILWDRFKDKLDDMGYPGDVVFEIKRGAPSDIVRSVQLWDNPEDEQLYLFKNNELEIRIVRDVLTSIGIDPEDGLIELLRIPKGMENVLLSLKQIQYVLIDGRGQVHLMSDTYPDVDPNIKWGLHIEKHYSANHLLFYDRSLRILVDYDVVFDIPPYQHPERLKRLIREASYIAEVSKEVNDLKHVVVSYDVYDDIIVEQVFSSPVRFDL